MSISWYGYELNKLVKELKFKWHFLKNCSDSYVSFFVIILKKIHYGDII